tara:strand:- start:51 stop:1559 length:1509 start_codon:yes stop_codon:yes gene_type:complete
MGTISRITTFSAGSVLTAAQLNNEFDNILATANGNLNAANLGVTAGIAAASKALVLDASRDLDDSTGGNQIRNLALAGTLSVTGNADFDGVTNLDAVDIDGAVQLDSTLTIGADDQGYDVILYGDTASANLTWDTSVDDLIWNGAARAVIPDSQLVLGSTAVTTTGAEINLIDGGTSRGTTAVASGDGILINDDGTMRMTNVDTVSTYFSSHSVGGGNIVTVGALNSGSITSGFGNIDTGSSTITTTGALAAGATTIGGTLDFNSGTIDLSTQTVDVTLNAAADALNFDSNTLSIDATNNRVGIGLAAPSRPLTVEGSLDVRTASATGNPQMAFRRGSTDVAYFTYWNASSTLALTNAAGAGMHFDPTNVRVGIGTAAPDRTLTVDGSVGVKTASATGSPQITFRQNTTDKAYLTYWDASDTLALTNASAAGLHFDPTNVRVGIGLSAPNEVLTVAGAVSITDGMTAPSATSGYAKLYVDTADGDLKVIFGDGTIKTLATDT